MKYAVLLSLIVLLLSAGKCNNNTTFNEEVTFQKHMIGRASWQWVIVYKKDSLMCKEIPDSLQIAGLSKQIQFKFTGKTDTLYEVGPVDIPIYYKELPLIEILN